MRGIAPGMRAEERDRERERQSNGEHQKKKGNTAPALDTLRLEVSLRGMRDLQP